MIESKPYGFESSEKIPCGLTLLLAEPVFKSSREDESAKDKFLVPLGAESWVQRLLLQKPNGPIIEEGLANEYLSIVGALKGMGVPFRIIIAHRKAMDERVTLVMLLHFQVRGLGLHEAISSTSFPRDMMVDFDGKTHLNPEANITFPDNSGIVSPLGEGGRVLKLGKKVFVPDERGFVQTRREYTNNIRRLSKNFQFGFLPHPLAVEIDVKTGSAKPFTNDHLDRVAAFIKGKDGKRYLLVDSHYAGSSHPLFGNYWAGIKEACRRLEVSPVVIERTQSSIPYALNLEQFADGSILLTGGDNALAHILRQIVGSDKVHTTDRPIVFYPLYRNGGIRCMLLFAPQKIVGKPVVAQV